MKRLLLFVLISAPVLFASEAFKTAAEMCFELSKGAVAAGGIAPMEWTQLSNGTPQAFMKIAEVTKALATDNPKTTVVALGAGALGCFIYNGVKYVSTVDPNKAGVGVLAGYGALHVLSDAKKALVSMVGAVDKEETRIKSELSKDLKKAAKDFKERLNIDNRLIVEGELNSHELRKFAEAEYKINPDVTFWEGKYLDALVREGYISQDEYESASDLFKSHINEIRN